MDQQDSLNPQVPAENNVQQKRESLQIVAWFLGMVVILAFPYFLLSTWSASCVAEEEFWLVQNNFGCDDWLYPLGKALFFAQATMAVFFGIISFLQKAPSELFIKIYLVSAGLTILPVLIMLGGNLSFFK